MRISGRNTSILNGEQVGLIIVLIEVSRDSEPQLESQILTDHLNSVRLINDSQTHISHTYPSPSIHECPIIPSPDPGARYQPTTMIETHPEPPSRRRYHTTSSRIE